MPDARPGLVGPGQTEREVGRPRVQGLVERPLEQSLSAEPVVPVAEAGDPVVAGQLGLGLTHLGHPEVVEAQIGGQVRLGVAPEERTGLGHIGPLSEPRSPPLVILGNGVELGKVVGDDLQRLEPSGVARLRWPPVRHGGPHDLTGQLLDAGPRRAGGEALEIELLAFGDQAPSQGGRRAEAVDGVGEIVGSVGDEKMLPVLDTEAFRPEGGGDHRDMVGESLHDLVPRAASEADRNHDHVGTGHLGGHIGNPAGHDDFGWSVERLDAPRGVTDQPDLGSGHLLADQRRDLPGQPFRSVGVRFVVEGPHQQDHRRTAVPVLADRGEGLRVGVDQDLGVGRPDPLHVLVAAEQHPVDFGGDRPLDEGPVLGVEVGLLGVPETAEAFLHGGGRLAADGLGPLVLLHVLEIDEVHHGGYEVGSTEPVVDVGRAEPDQVVVAAGHRGSEISARSGVGQSAGDLDRDASLE